MPKPEFDYIDKDFTSLKAIQDKITLDGKTLKILQEDAKKFAEENQERCKPVPRLWKQAVWKEITGEFIDKNDLGNKYWHSGRAKFVEEDSLLWRDDKDHITFLVFCVLKLIIKNGASNKRKNDAGDDEAETPTPKSKKAKKAQGEDRDGTETPQTGKKAKQHLEGEQDGNNTPQTGKKAKKNQKGEQNSNETPQTGKKAQHNAGGQQDDTPTPEPEKTPEKIQDGEEDSTEAPQIDTTGPVDQEEEHNSTDAPQTGKKADASSKAGATNAPEHDKDEHTIVVSTETPPAAKKKLGRPAKGTTPFKVPKMTKKLKEEQEKEGEMQRHAEEYAKKQAASSAEDVDDEDLPEGTAVELASSTKAVTSKKPKEGAKTNGDTVAAVQAADEELLGHVAGTQAQTVKLLLPVIMPEYSSDSAFPANDPSTPTPASKAKIDAHGTTALSIEGVDQDTKETSDAFNPEAPSLFGPLATPQASAGKLLDPYFRERDPLTPAQSNRVSSVYMEEGPIIEITFVITSKGHEQDPIRVKCLSNATFQHLFAEAQMISAGPARLGIGSTTCANLKIPGGAEVSMKFPDPELKKKWTGAMTMTVASVGDGNLHEAEEVLLYLT